MCLNPTYVWINRGPKWEKQPVACRKCWRCRDARINDYIGRSLAEASTSSSVCTLTLTYAPRDDLADKILTPRHFQNFIKSLRKAGHKIRYLVAGEYGETRARAHFHVILFFNPVAHVSPSALPWYNAEQQRDPSASRPFSDQLPHQKNCHIREWPHGHVFADWSCSQKAIRYVCKYLVPHAKTQSWFSCSKKPPLGAAWFSLKAEQAKQLGVMPSSFAYLPPGADREKLYPITGATRRDYLNAISTDPARKDGMNEWTLRSFEKYERARLIKALETQSPDVLEEAFIDRKQREADQAALAASLKREREASAMGREVSESPSGFVRWTPNKE